MLIPLKVLAPAEVVEHMPGWTMVAVSLGTEQERGNGYGVCVAVLVSPELAKDLTSNTVNEPHGVAKQVLVSAQAAVSGFLGAPKPDEPKDESEGDGVDWL